MMIFSFSLHSIRFVSFPLAAESPNIQMVERFSFRNVCVFLFIRMQNIIGPLSFIFSHFVFSEFQRTFQR